MCACIYLHISRLSRVFCYVCSCVRILTLTRLPHTFSLHTASVCLFVRYLSSLSIQQPNIRVVSHVCSYIYDARSLRVYTYLQRHQNTYDISHIHLTRRRCLIAIYIYILLRSALRICAFIVSRYCTCKSLGLFLLSWRIS